MLTGCVEKGRNLRRGSGVQAAGHVRMAVALFPVVLLLTGPDCQAGQVFRWVDEGGTVQFGDRPPATVRADSVNVGTDPVQQLPSAARPDALSDNRLDDGLPDRPEVTIFTSRRCPICRRAKRYFADNAIRFSELDIESSAEVMLQFLQLGGRGVPLIVVGDRKMHGFSAKRFAAFYRNR